jgi:hypothetical protein
VNALAQASVSGLVQPRTAGTKAAKARKRMVADEKKREIGEEGG